MLRQRVITALVLVAVLLATLAASSAWPFAVLMLIFMAAAGWEWGRLNDAHGAQAWALATAVAVAGAASLSADFTTQVPAALWWGGVVLWVLGGALALRAGPSGWPRLAKPARWLLGVVALWLAWLAVAQARTVSINFLLSVLCLVWMADVAAYFGGRAWGRAKLAPSISPGKSRAGVWSGMGGVLLLAVFWIWLDGRMGFDGASLYTRLFTQFGGLGMALALVSLCALSVVGDLVESLVKRAAGAKDSSQLLPGHGGVLDRVDALLPTLPAAMALMTWGAR